MDKILLKKITLFICIVLFSGCRQQIVEKYPNGNIKYIYYVKRFSKNILDGTYKEYYENGILKEDLTYRNGKLEEIQRTYFPDGKIKEVVNTKDHKCNGLDSGWYENGQLKYVKNFKNGKENGMSLKFYSSGNIMEIYNSKDTKLEGKRETYYANGGIKSKQEFKDGKLNGKITDYFPSGRIRRSLYLYNSCIPCDTLFVNDSMGILKYETVFNLDCDSLALSQKKDIKGVSYQYNRKGEIIKKKHFILDYDSLQRSGKEDYLKYLPRTITLKNKM